VGTNSSPVLTNSGFIQAGSSALDVGLRATPVVCDWNGDGKKDLVSGNDTGRILVFLNIGTNPAPAFGGTPTTVYCGASPIGFYRTSLEYFDLDNDGMKDLLVGDWYGYYHLYCNEGSNQAPYFSHGDTLKSPGDPPSYVWVDRSAKFDLVDWDDDGDLDIISGEWNAYVNLFVNITPSSIEEPHPEVPKAFYMSQNFPNPFNGTTTIQYQLYKPGDVNLSVYDITGQKITSLVEGYQTTGNYTVKWDANHLASGIYFYRLSTGKLTQTQTRKCFYMK
jgi:hypothetical protein